MKLRCSRRLIPGSSHELLEEHEILESRIAFALNPSNRVRSGSLDQVRQILLGKITNWAALGGDDLPIKVVLVGGGGGVTTVIESELLEGQPATGPHVIYVKTPVQVIQVVEQLPGAIGFAQVALTLKKDLPEFATEQADQTNAEFGHPRSADACHERCHSGFSPCCCKGCALSWRIILAASFTSALGRIARDEQKH